MARSATLDMTQGSLGRQIIGFSLPLMFTNLLQMLFSMVDLAVVGRFSSSAAMGSVGSTTTLIFLFTGFLMGLGSGVNVLVATHFGARSEKNVRESVHTSFLVCLIAGFLMLALGLIFARPLLELLNTRDDLIDGAELYLRIYFLGMPAAALYNYGNGVLNAIGDTKTPLIFLSAAGVLNVILDLVFVIGLGMSTDGVALASMLSQCVSAGLIVRSLMRSKEIYSLSLKEVRFHKDKAIHALSVGVPAGLQNAIFSVANLFIQAGVNSFSTVVVEGNSAAGNVDNLVYSVMNAFYIACSSFVGQNYGAGKSRRVLKSYLLTLCYSAVAAAVLGGLFLLFGHQFLSLFTSVHPLIRAESAFFCKKWGRPTKICAAAPSQFNILPFYVIYKNVFSAVPYGTCPCAYAPADNRQPAGHRLHAPEHLPSSWWYRSGSACRSPGGHPVPAGSRGSPGRTWS